MRDKDNNSLRSLQTPFNSEWSHRTLAENLPGIVYRVFAQENNRVHFFNKASEALTGYKDHELSRGEICSIESRMHPDDRPKVIGEIRDAIAAGSPFSVEYRFMHKDGHIKYFIENGMPINDSDGNLLYIDGIILDITERKQMEEKLRESEEKFRTIFASSGLGIVLADPQRRIIDCNQAMERMLGYTRNELLGKHVANISYPDDEVINVSISQKALVEQQKYFQIEKRYIRKDGGIIFGLLTVSNIYDNEGNCRFIIGMIEDITERKKAEEQIKRSLEEKEVLLKEIHHRVKNNMAVISSLLKLQFQYAKDEPYRGMLTESINRINTMALIHEKLYRSDDLARIDFNNYLDGMIDNIFTSYGLKSRGIALEKDVESITLGVDVAIPCGLIVNELVSNAFKHAFPGNSKGKIKVALRINEQDEVELSVRDDGIGIPGDFDFLNTGTLGLTLVNALVKQLLGKIDLQRERGTGYRITFRRRE